MELTKEKKPANYCFNIWSDSTWLLDAGNTCEKCFSPPTAFVQLEVCSSSSSQASYRRHPLPLLTGGDLGRHPEGHLAHRWLFDSQAMKTGDAFIRCSPLQAKVAVFTYKLPVSLSQRIFSLYHWSQQRRFCC